MRVSTVAVWTLAALAANQLPQAAISSPEPDVSEQTPVLDESIGTAVALEPMEAIAPPERWLGVPRFHRPASSPRAIASQPLSSPSAEPSLATTPQVDSIVLAPGTDLGAIAPPEQIVSQPLTSTAAPRFTPAAPQLETAPVHVVSARAAEQLAQVEGEVVEGEVIVVPPANSTADVPEAETVETLRQELLNLQPLESEYAYEGAPALTLSNPSGYGADRLRGFVSGSFQSRTRYSDTADGTLGVGIGLGDAQRSVGLQLSYTIASFGSNRDFGTGGFNAKLHHQFADGWSVAAGWEGFATIGDNVDFEDSIYGAVTHIIRTNPDLDTPFSRVALTAGVGNGRFRSEDDFNDNADSVGVFGSVAVRVARPVSAIVEWTGQDLSAGLSIAPIRNLPLVITPAFRDITGAGDGARFVLGVGLSFQL